MFRDRLSEFLDAVCGVFYLAIFLMWLAVLPSIGLLWLIGVL